MYIDAHSHQKSNETQILVGRDTLAFHPWELSLPFDRKTFDQQWEKKKTDNPNAIAIGECGLDRAHEGIASIEDQVYVLLKHFELAQERDLPIILHTVRAYSDLLAILKKIKFRRPILLHAYGGNDYEMQELSKYPVYFSYGARLFNTDKMIKITPLDRLLLETGDQGEYSIAEIYLKASESLGLSVNELQERVQKNFLTFFGKLDDVSAADFIQDLHRRQTV